MTLWKSHQIKREFFQDVAVLVLLYGCNKMDFNKGKEKKPNWELHKDAVFYFEQILEAAPHTNCNCTATDFSSCKPSQ